MKKRILYVTTIIAMLVVIASCDFGGNDTTSDLYPKGMQGTWIADDPIEEGGFSVPLSNGLANRIHITADSCTVVVKGLEAQGYMPIEEYVAFRNVDLEHPDTEYIYDAKVTGVSQTDPITTTITVTVQNSAGESKNVDVNLRYYTLPEESLSFFDGVSIVGYEFHR
ncbi:MAG: hypothetical protein IAA97_05405 [Spirochaetes bacterium]|uniref:Lipocalin-like domain-containing protein n=1 Tax=Candidatus Ornithospirochaeta stercoripullorum TaxID=2840899 RepID=A0A9D9E0E2_9SPIO|nr:hypothetical protein [Candidatus Ornithospirochaeta stercoripullorum]